MKIRSRALATVIAPLPILAGVILAAGAQAAPDPTQALAHNTSPALMRSARQGAVAADTMMSVSIGLKLRHTDELNAFLREVSDPSSPSYGNYLTPGQFLGAYGPSRQDVDAVRDYARSRGLSVTHISANRQVVDVTGSAAQMSKAFGTTFGEYTDPTRGRHFYANEQAPTLPVNIASVVQTLSGLDNHNVMRHYSIPSPQGASAAAQSGNQAAPRGFAPSQLHGMYDTDPLTAKGVDGKGGTVAVWEFDGYQQQNIAAFDKEFSITSAPPVTKSVDGADYDKSPGQGQGEVELDIEVIRGMAPGASQIVYEAPNSDAGSLDMLNAIVSDNKASVTSISWGSCEANTSASSMTSMDNAFKQGAAQGISFYAATGDSGSDDCGKGSAAVDYPSSDPFVTGVGGTTLTASGNSYGSETGWSGSGGGVSTQFAAPSWQPGSNGKRTLPDVASDADPKTGYAIFSAGKWMVYGGTSCAAPMWAGFTALYNQSAAAAKKPNLGYANPVLYKVGGGDGYQSAFHDVTSGSNGGFQAGAGYDQVTGWGSYDGAKLVATLLGG